MEEIANKQPEMKKKKVLFHQDNTLCHKSFATIAKLHELHFELLLCPPYWLLANVKRMLQGKRFDSNEEVISETEAYFVLPKGNRIVQEALESVYYT